MQPLDQVSDWTGPGPPPNENKPDRPASNEEKRESPNKQPNDNWHGISQLTPENCGADAQPDHQPSGVPQPKRERRIAANEDVEFKVDNQSGAERQQADPHDRKRNQPPAHD